MSNLIEAHFYELPDTDNYEPCGNLDTVNRPQLALLDRLRADAEAYIAHIREPGYILEYGPAISFEVGIANLLRDQKGNFITGRNTFSQNMGFGSRDIPISKAVPVLANLRTELESAYAISDGEEQVPGREESEVPGRTDTELYRLHGGRIYWSTTGSQLRYSHTLNVAIKRAKQHYSQAEPAHPLTVTNLSFELADAAECTLDEKYTSSIPSEIMRIRQLCESLAPSYRSRVPVNRRLLGEYIDDNFPALANSYIGNPSENLEKVYQSLVQTYVRMYQEYLALNEIQQVVAAYCIPPESLLGEYRNLIPVYTRRFIEKYKDRPAGELIEITSRADAVRNTFHRFVEQYGYAVLGKVQHEVFNEILTTYRKNSSMDIYEVADNVYIFRNTNIEGKEQFTLYTGYQDGYEVINPEGRVEDGDSGRDLPAPIPTYWSVLTKGKTEIEADAAFAAGLATKLNFAYPLLRIKVDVAHAGSFHEKWINRELGIDVDSVAAQAVTMGLTTDELLMELVAVIRDALYEYRIKSDYENTLE